MTNLNDATILKARKAAIEAKKRKALLDSAQPGLLLRIGVSGTMTWTLACRDPQNHVRKFALGAYPGLGIKEARIKARRLREDVRDGKFTVAESKRQRAGVNTLDDLIEAYGATDLKGKTWDASIVRVRRVYKNLLDIPLDVLKLSDFFRCYDAYPHPADFAARTLRPILKWGAKRDYLCHELTRVESRQPPKRQRFLSEDELSRVLPYLSASASMHAKAMLFMLWTMCRRREATMATWNEINFKTGIWTLPAARIKDNKKGGTKIDFKVRLPRQALKFLTAHKPAGAEADDLIFPNRGGNELSGWDRVTGAIHQETGTSDWHRHDLRRTGATMLAKMHVAPHIIDSCLNHANVVHGVARHYIVDRYEAEAAEALQKLADRYERDFSQ